jgi:uncharacterized Zn finger protein (UPF0148 family)
VRSHGEDVRRVDGEVVCACCGTTHDIDQSRTLVEHRRPQSGRETVEEPTIADGGEGVRTADAREEELRERWPSASAAASVGESTERAKIRERIEIVADAHPDLTDLELAAKYDAIEHVDVVREVRSGADTDPSEVVGFDRGDRPPDWEIVSVTVDGEERPASGGGGPSFVEVVDYGQRFDFIRDGWYRCDCGVRLFGAQMARHLGHVHGIDEASIARSCVHREC